MLRESNFTHLSVQLGQLPVVFILANAFHLRCYEKRAFKPVLNLYDRDGERVKFSLKMTTRH